MGLSLAQKLALLKLYSNEISNSLKCIYHSNSNVGSLADLLDLNRIPDLSMECETASEFAHKLFNELMMSPLNRILYENLMNFLTNLDSSDPIHRIISMTESSSRHTRFGIVLANLDRFMNFVDITATLDFFKKFRRFENVAHELSKNLEEEIDEDMKKHVLLRSLPIFGRNSVLDVLNLIYTSGSPEAVEFVNSVQPNFKRYYDFVTEGRKNGTSKVFYCPKQMCATDFMRKMGTVLTELDQNIMVVDLNEDTIPVDDGVEELLTRTIIMKTHLEEKIILRDYQKELCEFALNGENTIISSPTGTGKTVMAAHIIKSHLDYGRRNGSKAKVLFLTPTGILLEQQYNLIDIHTRNLYKATILQGCMEIPIVPLIMANDIIVATPQMIVNVCEGFSDDSLTGIVSFELSTFTLIIFDECHNTVKQSPYANLMKKYLADKHKGIEKLPQIVGLTASLAVGGVKDVDQACHKVAESLALMDVFKISTPNKYLDQVKRFSSNTSDECLYIPRNNDTVEENFEKELKIFMSQIERELVSKCNAFLLPGCDKGETKYLNWVSVLLKTEIPKMTFLDQTVKKTVTELAEILKCGYLALELANDFNTELALNFVHDYMSQSNVWEGARRIWREYYPLLNMLKTTDNLLVTELMNTLLKKFYTNREDFRAIIFIRTRQGAILLCDILSKNEDLKREGISTAIVHGTNRPTSAMLETAKKMELQQTLKRFQNGELKVLVATSVAEEGLDIAKCNLVVKYNYCTNEIAHVQRRGRCRATNSTCILLTNNGRLKKQEDENRLKENLMKQVMTNIRLKNFDLEALVRKKQDPIIKDILSEFALKSETAQKLRPALNSFNLLCKKCDSPLCSSGDLRCSTSSHVIVNQEIWSKVTKQLNSPSAVQKKYEGIGKFWCLKCQALLGQLVLIKNVTFPCISATSLVIVSKYNKEERTAPKNWKAIKTTLFDPEHLRQYDIEHMRVATFTDSIERTY